MATEQQWVDRFAMALGNMGVRAAPERLIEMGRELYPIPANVHLKSSLRSGFNR